jgi:hypothetical protein
VAIEEKELDACAWSSEKAGVSEQGGMLHVGRRAASRKACTGAGLPFPAATWTGRGGAERKRDVPARLNVLRRSGADGKMQAWLLAVAASEQSRGSMCWSRWRDAAARDGVSS